MMEREVPRDLVEELFQGEGALPRPPREEVEDLRETVQVFSRLPSPRPSGRVLEEVKRHLHHQRRIHQGARRPWRASLSLETFRAAFRESWLVKGLAAAVLVQVLALPILGAMSFWGRDRVSSGTSRTGVNLKEMIQRLLPAREEVQQEVLPQEMSLDLEEGKVSRTPSTYREWLVRENRIKEKWLFFSARKALKKPGKSLLSRPEVRGKVESFLAKLSRSVSRELGKVRDPLDLALGLRALFLSGNTEVDGPFSRAVKKNLPRLLKAWNRAGDRARIEIGVLLVEMEILDGGDRRHAVAGVFRWLTGRLSPGRDLSRLPSWALADAAQILQWGPVLVNRNFPKERERLKKELLKRLKRGGQERREAAGALLRAFYETLPEEILLAHTGLPGKGKLDLAMEDPFLLVLVSWAPARSSRQQERFLRNLEEAALMVELPGFRARALWLLSLGACYAARNR